MPFGMLTGNAIIDCSLLAWFLAQLIKVLLDLLLVHQFRVERFVSSGGMPSSHSAFVVSCTTAIGRLHGVDGPLFALAVVLSSVVMYDACNVRRSAGDTAHLVNELLGHLEKLTAQELADNLKEVMGHTPLQVAAGAILGLLVGLLV